MTTGDIAFDELGFAQIQAAQNGFAAKTVRTVSLETGTTGLTPQVPHR